MLVKERVDLEHLFYFQVVLSHLLPVLDRLLEKALKGSEGMLKDEALLLHLILGKYNEHSAALLCTNQRCLDLFIKALHVSQEVCKGLTFQIRALGQVREGPIEGPCSSSQWNSVC